MLPRFVEALPIVRMHVLGRERCLIGWQRLDIQTPQGRDQAS